MRKKRSKCSSFLPYIQKQMVRQSIGATVKDFARAPNKLNYYTNRQNWQTR